MKIEFLEYLGFKRFEQEVLESIFKGYSVFTLLTRELIPIDGTERFQLQIYKGIQSNRNILIFEFDTLRFTLEQVDQEYTIQQHGFPPTICFQLQYCLLLIYPDETKSAKYLKQCSKKMSDWLRDSGVVRPKRDVMKLDLCPLIDSIRDMDTKQMLLNYNEIVNSF